MFSINPDLLYALLFVLALIFVDIVLGIAISLQNGTFNIEKLPSFLETQILPYYMSLLALVFLAQLKDIQNLGTTSLAWAALAAYAAKMIWVDIASKVKTLFGVGATTSPPKST
jgi:hypothetical protein